MVMKKVLFFVGLVLLCLFVGSVSAMSGSGTASDPYILTTSSDLTALSGTGLAGYGANAYYELGADIDMSEVANFEPIGTNSVAFAGHFDGKNHTISNLNMYFNLAQASGLFTKVTNAEISNLIIDNSTVNVAQPAYYYGSSFVVGVVNNQVVISNVCVKNSYMYSSASYHNVGAIVGGGMNILGKTLSISDCRVINTIIDTKGQWTGAIMGRCINADNIISNCTVENTYIRCTQQSGIICGYGYYNISISGCNAVKSTIVGSGSNIGGVIGGSDSGYIQSFSVTDCTVSDCTIIGTSNVSGVGN